MQNIILGLLFMPVNEYADLLIEFLTEELPPINLERDIGISFSQTLSGLLKNFTPQSPKVTHFVSPRRFGCIIHDTLSAEADSTNVRRGPAIANSLKDQEPTPALLGFAKSCNLSWQDLEQRDDGYFYATIHIKGHKLENILADALITSLKKLPVAKNMRWGNNDYAFVRPMHNLLILHGNKPLTLDSQIMGLIPNNYTFGHRVMSKDKIIIDHANNYLDNITQQGMVIAEFQLRMKMIQEQLETQARNLDLCINEVPELLAEVAALVEYPVVLHGEFNPEFLEIPPECLILSMAKNQKYFALLDNNKQLSNKFLFVANIAPTNPNIVIHGNEKVLSARLQDAKFFFDVDKKNPPDVFVEKLKTVVYHNKLGSQLDRIVRLQNIASQIAGLLKVNPDIAKSTAYLLKADLVSEMVGEFPELQGIMGKYYARLHGESDEVANAIEKHYYPRFSGDTLPEDNLAIVMALSDKLETLIGIWGIGLQPTGDKDPFALRRAALGISRILLKHNLDIRQLLEISFAAFPNEYSLDKNTVNEVYLFILGRLENYFSPDYSINCIKSVLAKQPAQFIQIPSILEKLNNFAQNTQNNTLLQANKRIENILTKNGYLQQNNAHEFNAALLEHNAEKALYEHWLNIESQITISTDQHDWETYFKILSSFNQPIADFFDNVMVMTDNPQIQQNRISLLTKLYQLSNKICNLSELD